jgi:hypothetical protein
MFNSGTLLWKNGNNICVDILLHVGRCHDKVLKANQREPCGSVVDVFMEAIPFWNDYENGKKWIFERSQEIQKFEAAMKAEQKWAITAPEVKGAVGLVLHAVLAYYPGLCFTNIAHHDKNSSGEIKNNRGMAMLPRQHSIAMFSLLKQSGYVPPFPCISPLPHCIFVTSFACTSPRTATLTISGKHRQCACHPTTAHWMFPASKVRFENRNSEYGARAKKTASILEIPRLYGAYTPPQAGLKSPHRCGVKLVLAGTCCCRCCRRFKSNEFFPTPP